jgi:hypothetical protein
MDTSVLATQRDVIFVDDVGKEIGHLLVYQHW